MCTLIKRILFSVFILSLLSFTMHKYYVSITEAEYNAVDKTFEISIKFIGHDLEKALEKAGVPNLYLGTPKEHESANTYLKKYIEKRLNITVNDKLLTHRFLGKKVRNDDFIYCFIQTSKTEFPKNITIKNTLLTEVFNEQANTVYLNIGDQKLNCSFNRNKVIETLEI